MSTDTPESRVDPPTLRNFLRRLLGVILYQYCKAPYHRGKRHVLTWIHRIAGPAILRSDFGPLLACYMTSAESSLVFRDEYNAPLEALLLQRLDGIDVFVDIGAHIGLFSLIASQKSAGRVRCIAFEPSPREFARLALNACLNGVTRITPLPVALGAKTALVRLAVMAEHLNTGMNQIVDENGDEGRTIEVMQLTLDVLRDLDARRAFIKIDTEGYEFDVLSGGRNFLAGLASGTLVLEFTPKRAGELGYTFEEVISLLDGCGFVLERRIPSPNGWQEDVVFAKTA